MARLCDVLTIQDRPFKFGSLKRNLTRLAGTAETVPPARQAREEFINQLDTLEIDKRHVNWAADWLNGLFDDRSARSWLKRKGVSVQSEWNVYVEKRRQEASKPKPAPLPVKSIHLRPNDKLSISKRYKSPGWV